MVESLLLSSFTDISNKELFFKNVYYEVIMRWSNTVRCDQIYRIDLRALLNLITLDQYMNTLNYSKNDFVLLKIVLVKHQKTEFQFSAIEHKDENNKNWKYCIR